MRPSLGMAVALGLLAGAPGCAASHEAGPRLLPAVGPECTSIGRVEGEAHEPRQSRDVQLEWATRQALDRARALGATHLVVDGDSGPANGVTVSGVAYRCPWAACAGAPCAGTPAR